MPEFLPESSFYDRLPSSIKDADTRSSLWAIIAAYQDTYQDLHDVISLWQDVASPDLLTPGSTYAVTFTPDEITNPITVYISRSEYVGDGSPDASWAAGILQVSESCIIDVSDGPVKNSALTTSLRARLLEGLGETASGMSTNLMDRLITTYFSRLAWRSTPTCYRLTARCYGYDGVSFLPLWSRLSCRCPGSYGNSENDADFSSVPQVSVLDQGANATNFRDGDLFTYSCSGLTVANPESATYWPQAINGNNPFIAVSVTSPLSQPDPGEYALSGGLDGVQASAVLPCGKASSGITVKAIINGASFNGLVVRVSSQDDGTRRVDITDNLSAIKYRSSFFDIYVIKSYESLLNYVVPVRPNADRLSAGSGYLPIGAMASSTELDLDAVYGDATPIFSAFDAIRPASRHVRKSGVIVSSSDDVVYLSGSATGSGACYDIDTQSVTTYNIPSQDGYALMAWYNGVKMSASVSDMVVTYFNPEMTTTVTYNLVTGAVTVTNGGQILHLQWDSDVTAGYRQYSGYDYPTDAVDDRGGFAWYDTTDSYWSARPITGRGISVVPYDAALSEVRYGIASVLDGNNNSQYQLGLSPVSNRGLVLSDGNGVRAVAHYGSGTVDVHLVNATLVAGINHDFYSLSTHWFPFNGVYPEIPGIFDVSAGVKYKSHGEYKAYGSCGESYVFLEDLVLSDSGDTATFSAMVVSSPVDGFGHGTITIHGQVVTCNGFSVALNGVALPSLSPLMIMVVSDGTTVKLKYASALFGDSVWSDGVSTSLNTVTSEIVVSSGVVMTQFMTWDHDATVHHVMLRGSDEAATPLFGRHGLTSAECFVDVAGKVMLGHGSLSLTPSFSSTPFLADGTIEDYRVKGGFGFKDHLGTIWQGYTGDGQAVGKGVTARRYAYALTASGGINRIKISDVTPKVLERVQDVDASEVTSARCDFYVDEHGVLSQRNNTIVYLWSDRNLIVSDGETHDLNDDVRINVPAMSSGTCKILFSADVHGHVQFPALILIKIGQYQVLTSVQDGSSNVDVDINIGISYTSGCQIQLSWVNKRDGAIFDIKDVSLYKMHDQVFKIEGLEISEVALVNTIDQLDCNGQVVSTTPTEGIVGHLTGSTNDCDSLELFS